MKSGIGAYAGNQSWKDQAQKRTDYAKRKAGDCEYVAAVSTDPRPSAVPKTTREIVDGRPHPVGLNMNSNSNSAPTSVREEITQLRSLVVAVPSFDRRFFHGIRSWAGDALPPQYSTGWPAFSSQSILTRALRAQSAAVSATQAVGVVGNT